MYNHKLGKYVNYYNTCLLDPTATQHIHSLSFLYKKNFHSCLIFYPILYKRIIFFNFGCFIKKRKRMKNRYNLNQTIILEGTISSNKCRLSIPVLSFLNKFKVF